MADEEQYDDIEENEENSESEENDDINHLETIKQNNKTNENKTKFNLKKITSNCALLIVNERDIYIFDYKRKIFVGKYLNGIIAPFSNCDLLFLHNKKLKYIILNNTTNIY